jgi:hypothetical protein
MALKLIAMYDNYILKHGEDGSNHGKPRREEKGD